MLNNQLEKSEEKELKLRIKTLSNEKAKTRNKDKKQTLEVELKEYKSQLDELKAEILAQYDNAKKTQEKINFLTENIHLKVNSATAFNSGLDGEKVMKDTKTIEKLVKFCFVLYEIHHRSVNLLYKLQFLLK